MESALHILHLEDDPLDSKLVANLLRKEGMNATVERVATSAGFEDSLRRGTHALILSDYTIPGINVPEQLRLAKKSHPDLPIVIFSGTMGDDLGIEMLKLGASDYVLKHRKERLVPAIRRALHEAEEQTRRREAESALRESERMLRLALTAAQMGTWDFDVASGSVSFDERALSILGGELEAGVFEDVMLARIRPEDAGRIESVIRAALMPTSDGVVSAKHRVAWPDGTTHWVQLDAQTVFAGEGNLRRAVRMVGTIKDVTEIERTQEELRKSEERMRLAQQVARIGSFEWNLETLQSIWSPELEALHGLPQGSFDGSHKTWTALVHPEDFPEADRRAKESVSSGTLDCEWRVVRPDGTIRWLAARGQVINDASGKPARLVGLNLDITEQKQAEALLRKRALSLSLLSDVANQLLLGERTDLAIRESIEMVARQLGMEVFFHFLVSDDGTLLQLSHCAGVDATTRRFFDRLKLGEAICGSTAHQRERIVLNDVQLLSDPKSEVLRSIGLRLYVCQPLIARERLVGTLSFGTRNRDRISDEELELLATVSSQVAMAIERGRLLVELEQRAKDLAAAKASAETAKAAAEQANQAKDQFLAVLSHELRTPLSPVLTGISLLREQLSGLAPSTGELLETIQRNVEMEARLIDDLLDLTRIAREKVELHRERIDLSVVLERAIEVCRPDIEARGLHFAVDCGSAFPYWVDVDAGRLQQVFWNLIKNSIKFTPEKGCLGIRCGLTAAHQVLVEVTDSGIGIDEEALPRIFNAFEQAERSITRKFGGLGLGLAISRALVEMHGGTIEAGSAGRGKGASFRVRLPLADPPVTRPEPKINDSLATKGHALKILVVEDHGDSAHLLRVILERKGHEVTVAGDVAAALKIADSKGFNLLISDLGLPDGSGYDLLAELRTRGNKIHAIALSGYGQPEDVRRSLSAGFSQHLTKPVAPGRLAEALAKMREEMRNL